MVLIQDATLLRGTERAAISLANALADFGHTVSVISVFSNDQTLAYPLSDGVEVRHLGIKREVQGSHLKRVFKLIGVIRALHPLFPRRAIVIASEDMLALAALFARQSSSLQIIAWEHLLHWDTARLVLLLRKLFFRFMSAVVVLNRDDMTYFKGIGVKNVYIIPNINSFPDIIKTSAVHRRLIAVGAHVQDKGFARLIQHAAPVLRNYPDWKLTIVGRDVPGSELTEIVKAEGVHNQTELLGPTRDISAIYLQSSICVVTSYRESFSLVITEAKSRGLPTLAYDCPAGPRELISDGIDGYLVNDGDVLTFRNRLHTLISDQNLRNEMSQAAALSAENYTAKQVYQLWKPLL